MEDGARRMSPAQVRAMNIALALCAELQFLRGQPLLDRAGEVAEKIGQMIVSDGLPAERAGAYWRMAVSTDNGVMNSIYHRHVARGIRNTR